MSNGVNQNLFNFLNDLALNNFWIDTIIIFLAQFLGYFLLAVFFVLLFWGKDWKDKYSRKKIFLISFLSVIFSRLVFTEIIRFFYPLNRPFVENTVNQLLFHETSYSFPSGHAAFYFALAISIFLFDKKWGAVFLIGAVMISAARIMAGIHWPMDILGGLFVSFPAVFLSRFLAEKLNLA